MKKIQYFISILLLTLVSVSGCSTGKWQQGKIQSNVGILRASPDAKSLLVKRLTKGTALYVQPSSDPKFYIAAFRSPDQKLHQGYIAKKNIHVTSVPIKVAQTKVAQAKTPQTKTISQKIGRAIASIWSSDEHVEASRSSPNQFSLFGNLSQLSPTAIQSSMGVSASTVSNLSYGLRYEFCPEAIHQITPKRVG